MPSRRPDGGGADRVEQRDLEEDAGRVVAAARALAAHQPGDALHPVGVGDHGDIAVERVGPPVERTERLARAREAHGEVARDRAGVEHVQRPREVERHVVGDIDQGGDRPQPDGAQPVLQPLRAGAVLEAAEIAPGDHRAGVAPALGKVAPPLHRALERALHRRDVERLERAEPGGGEVAGDAADAGAVAAVGRERDVDHRVGHAECGGGRRSHRRVVLQLDDARVLVGQPELALRAQHAVRILAADLAGLEVEPGARDVRARRGEYALHAGARIGRAADHLHDALAGIDAADLEPVGIGVLHRLDDIADDERREVLRAVLDAFDLQPDHGELVGESVGGRVGLEMVLQPGNRNLHRASPPCNEGTSSAAKP